MAAPADAGWVPGGHQVGGDEDTWLVVTVSDTAMTCRPSNASSGSAELPELTPFSPAYQNPRPAV